MSEPVKRRSYDSSVRRDQARMTRARILDAAALLLARDGYARTTIRAVADEADVAVDTVYAVFKSKQRIVTALIDRQLTAGAELRNVMERPEALAIRDEGDQIRQIRMFAEDIAGVVARVRPIYDIMTAAAAADEGMASIYTEMQSYRAKNMLVVAQWIAARGPLRVPVERASEIMWALASPEMHRMLRDGRGWTAADHTDWLADMLTHALLPDRPSRKKSGAARRR